MKERSEENPDEGFKVGPMPTLPPLPKSPYPYSRPYLFTDGHVTHSDGGFVWAMYLDSCESLGFARAVPYGVAIETDEQKLHLLGRKKFTPKLTKEIIEEHRSDPFCGLVQQGIDKIRPRPCGFHRLGQCCPSCGAPQAPLA
jgi:hypothetical protein